jgi:hypothetical protein
LGRLGISIDNAVARTRNRLARVVRNRHYYRRSDHRATTDDCEQFCLHSASFPLEATPTCGAGSAAGDHKPRSPVCETNSNSRRRNWSSSTRPEELVVIDQPHQFNPSLSWARANLAANRLRRQLIGHFNLHLS